MKKIIITGASGMVGGNALEYLLENEEVGEVLSFVRKSSDKSHAKLKEIVVPDFYNYENSGVDFSNVDAALFCIGVYTGAVDRETFAKITIDMTVVFAEALKAASPNATFCLLSGMGADRTEKSRTMFAKDKGIVENKLEAMNFGAFHTFRPGYIYPVVPREEPNLMYRISRWLYPVLKYMGRNASIKSTDLAMGMVLSLIHI